MKNLKKIVLGMGASALFASAAIIGHHSAGSNTGNSLLAENIEALTAKEIVTTTSWNCSAESVNECGAQCTICGASVKGSGSLNGEHRCTTIEL